MEQELIVGQLVRKVTGYRFNGTVVATFNTLAGKRRVVVDNGDGLLHIFSEQQLEGVESISPPPADEGVERRVCLVCKAVVAAYPKGMCCHCQELPWPIEDKALSFNQGGER